MAEPKPTLDKLFENLKATVASAEPDVTKTVNGTAAAGTRVRKAMQNVKNTAQEIRKAVMDARG